MILDDVLREYELVKALRKYFLQKMSYVQINDYALYITNNRYTVNDYYNKLITEFGVSDHLPLFLQCYGEMLVMSTNLGDTAKQKVITQIYD